MASFRPFILHSLHLSEKIKKKEEDMKKEKKPIETHVDRLEKAQNSTQILAPKLTYEKRRYEMKSLSPASM